MPVSLGVKRTTAFSCCPALRFTVVGDTIEKSALFCPVSERVAVVAPPVVLFMILIMVESYPAYSLVSGKKIFTCAG